MKLLILGAFLAFVVIANAENKECGDPEKDGEIKAWFKNAGCTVKKSYDEISEAAKPYAETISNKAKELGHTVAQTYGDVKQKFSSNDDSHKDGAYAQAYVEPPTAKVPLAPLPAQHTTGEDKQTASPKSVEPDSFDDRFLLQNNECPEGQVHDHMKRCRPKV